MSDDRFTGVWAHRILNSVSAIHGLLAVARSLHETDPTNDEIERLLRSAEARAEEVATQLHQLVRGQPDVIDLDVETPASEERQSR